MLSSDNKVRCISKACEDYNAVLEEGEYINYKENEKIPGDFERLLIKYTYKDLFEVAINELKALRDNSIFKTDYPVKIGWDSGPKYGQQLAYTIIGDHGQGAMRWVSIRKFFERARQLRIANI